MLIKILPIICLIASCASNQLMDPTKLYKKEVDFTINDQKAKGMYAQSKSPAYRIVFELHKEAVVKITTCHREETFREVGKRLEYLYRPVEGLENVGYCPLLLGAFDRDGAHSWGMIDFQDTETLSATVGCSGSSYKTVGVSVCQSKAGLIQTIKFEKPVKVFSTEACAKAETQDQKRFTIEVSRDVCLYLFSDGDKEHRLTLFGYDEVYIK